MIISPTRGFVFVHVAKTAGTSITRAYARHALWDDVIVGASRYGREVKAAYERKFRLSTHSSAHRIRDVIGADRWAGLESMAVVRDPVERMLSTYGYLQDQAIKRGLQGTEPAGVSDPTMGLYLTTDDFSSFLMHPDFPTIVGPQTAMVLDRDTGDLLVDRIIPMEGLTETWPEVAAAMGVPDLRLERRNRSGVKAPKPVASASDVARIRDVMAADFEHFDY